MRTKLSVNINKVALIRNARGGNLPDLKQVAIDCQDFGADGITVHPRPDERHVRYSDLPILREVVHTEFNIEGYPNEKFINEVLSVVPDQCTLVPDPPGVLTSSEGWNIAANEDLLTNVIKRLKDKGIRVSLFMDATSLELAHAKAVGADRVELYTGDYAHAQGSEVLLRHKKAAEAAYEIGLGLNAGHDLNLKNLKKYVSSVPRVLEVSIGHALISDSLYYGLSNTIKMYRKLLS